MSKDSTTKTLTAALLLAALTVAGVSISYGFGFASANTAVASPSLPPLGTLGIGRKTVAPYQGPFTIDSKISLETSVEDETPLETRVERKAVPIPKPKPVTTPAKTTSASARAAAPAPSRSSASTSGWKSAKVSWYGPGFYGQSTASGHILSESSMIAAHRSLPFGTKIQFEYNGRTCTATVQDRGPHVSGREFDLGPGTAKALGFSGVGTVKYRVVS